MLCPGGCRLNFDWQVERQIQGGSKGSRSELAWPGMVGEFETRHPCRRLPFWAHPHTKTGITGPCPITARKTPPQLSTLHPSLQLSFNPPSTLLPALANAPPYPLPGADIFQIPKSRLLRSTGRASPYAYLSAVAARPMSPFALVAPLHRQVHQPVRSRDTGQHAEQHDRESRYQTAVGALTANSNYRTEDRLATCFVLTRKQTSPSPGYPT